MKLLDLASRPFDEIPYRAAAPGSRGTEEMRLPFLEGCLDALPPGVEALVCASDLQGVASVEGGRDGLLGIALAERLERLAADGIVPPLAAMGVLLAGDLYSDPAARMRGATGDVRPVWRALADRCRWVIGVAGNHDRLGPPGEGIHARAHLLDGRSVEVDGLRVGGVGGIVGKPRKLNRRDERGFVGELRRVLASRPDVLLLHQGPEVPEERLLGNAAVRETLEGHGEDLLVVAGHAHWRIPLVGLTRTNQVLNVDSRVVLLRATRGHGVEVRD